MFLSVNDRQEPAELASKARGGAVYGGDRHDLGKPDTQASIGSSKVAGRGSRMVRRTRSVRSEVEARYHSASCIAKTTDARC
jgi:hypothetical protein